MGNKNSTVDILKFVFAICIVMIHTGFHYALPEKMDWYFTHTILRLGVPFFFITSGYFYGRKFVIISDNPQKRKECCQSYVKRNVPFLLFWGAIGLAFYGLQLISSGENHIFLRLMQSALFYPRGAMWFTLACIVAVAIISLFWRYKITLSILAGGGYIFALICNTYYFVIEGLPIQRFVDNYLTIFISARNGVFVGLLFIGLGIWLSTKDISKISIRLVAGSLIVCFMILIFEVYICHGKNVQDDSSLFFTSPFISVLLLLLALKLKIGINMETSLLLRRISGNLYYIHPAINSYIGTLVYRFTENYIARFLIVLILCSIIWFLTRNSKNRFIRRILP